MVQRCFCCSTLFAFRHTPPSNSQRGDIIATNLKDNYGNAISLSQNFFFLVSFSFLIHNTFRLGLFMENLKKI